MAILAEMSFFGNFTCPRNMGDAFARYSDLATNCDNGTFHHMLGFMYATGIGGATKRDTAKALLHHTVAAQAGNTQSQMTLGYRYLAGVGVTPSCEVARSFYKSAAEKAVGWYRSGPVGGKQWMSGQLRLADEKGGVYGGGASVSSSGYNAKQKGTIHDGSVEDMIEYLEMMVSKGEHKATLHLGIVYYDGQRGLAPNHVLARKYFQSVAGQYWARDGTAKDVKDQPGLEKQAAKAAGYLGRMYLRGESVEANHTKALEWFKRGVALGDASSQYGNGLMVLHGLGTEQNAERAAAMFSAASDQQYHPAQVELGKLYLDQGTSEDLLIAQRYFEVAARYQNIEAQYYLAEMASMGLGEERLCSTALAYYKSVAEKADPFTSSLTEANEVYHAGDRELALIEYMMAAEQGYEVGQSNAAYLVDNQKSMLELPALHSSHQSNSSILHNDNLALLYWTRSAKQSNIDSLVKMGDYYLDGIGTEPDADKAAACYTAASDYSQSAQAFYNLGWMHENGVSLTQDFHLAKRFYDRALHTNTEAYLPVKLSLLKLRLRSAWNTLTHGKINSIHDEPGKHGVRKSY